MRIKLRPGDYLRSLLLCY